jgi:Skp family chaperone for outer membrane proteins
MFVLAALLVPQAVILSPSAAEQASQKGALSTGLRVGYISLQRIVSGSAYGKAEVARITTLQQQKAAELKAKQQALEATRERVAKATEATLADLQRQEQAQRAELERDAVQAQNELQTLQREMQVEILTKIKTVVEELAKAQNVQLVLHGDQAVVWTEPGMDMTAAVIERLNALAAPSTAKP